jgi:serine protease inhibitor
LVLPKEVDGLVRLVEQLTPESIREAILLMKKKDIHLTIPKFNIKHKVDIKNILTKVQKHHQI